jgi:hypothetical protein
VYPPLRTGAFRSPWSGHENTFARYLTDYQPIWDQGWLTLWFRGWRSAVTCGFPVRAERFHSSHVIGEAGLVAPSYATLKGRPHA